VREEVRKTNNQHPMTTKASGGLPLRFWYMISTGGCAASLQVRCRREGKGRASDEEYMRLGMVLTPLQPTTVVRKSPGVEQ